MMCLASNRQRMYYSLQLGQVPIYETDDEGNILYEYYEDDDGNIIYLLDDNGEKIPIPTGEMEIGYSEPTEFFANITNKLNEVTWKDYGIDNSTNFAQLLTSKGELPLEVGSIVWKKSEIGYKDDNKTIVDSSTADYTVSGVADEGLNFDLFLLRKNVK